MDESTENVTLYAGFVADVLREYEPLRSLCGPVFELAQGVDIAARTTLAPIETYNAVCDWIEINLGAASIRDAGRAIGGPVYEHMLAANDIGDGTSPVRVLEGLKLAADTMIQDPKGRGWTILDHNERSCRMRRTQTFNCVLQEGLLAALVARTRMPSVVAHERCTRRGDEFCEYVVRWIPPLSDAPVAV